MTARSSRPLRVHALISSLTWGGAEMLLAEFAAGAPAAGIELSVGFLEDRDGNPAAARLRERGVEPVLAADPRAEAAAQPGRPSHRAPAPRARAPDVVHTHLGYADMLGRHGRALAGHPGGLDDPRDGVGARACASTR